MAVCGMEKLFVVTACFIVLSNATVHFVVELKPRTVRAPIGTNVTLECSTSYNLPLIPLWGIDGADYRVTELPLGYEADGANITFRAFNDTTIFCFFNVFNVSTGNFEVVHSNNVTITATPSQDTPDSVVGNIEKCQPTNITIRVLDKELYISWDIQHFAVPFGCSFFLTVRNCSQPETSSLNCHYHAPNPHVKRLPLTKCLKKDYPYRDGTIIDIKWDNADCDERDKTCSTEFYIPELNETAIIPRDMDGPFADLSNPYCETELSQSPTLRLCFASTPTQDFDGCFDKLRGNKHFELKTCANDTCIEVKGINPSLNATVISIFCITTPDNCQETSYIETNIFNFVFTTNVCNSCSPNATCEDGRCICKEGFTGDGIRCNLIVCDNCSQNATCEDGRCMCKKGFTGDGIRCDPIGMCSNNSCSQNATCEDGQCVCKDGYTGDGIKCKRDESKKSKNGLIIGISVPSGIALLLLLLLLLVILVLIWRRRKKKNSLNGTESPSPSEGERTQLTQTQQPTYVPSSTGEMCNIVGQT